MLRLFRGMNNNVPRQAKILHLAYYSRRSQPKNLDDCYKVVKAKDKVQEEENIVQLGKECGPNWELLSPRSNRFYFPNGVGPAWQGASTTLTLDAPLETLVNFDDKPSKNKALLTFSVDTCPSLIRNSLHELFPAAEVVNSKLITLVTLRFKGDVEQGARKFVLAAREITSRLRLHGYWADFMNPFSGKPFHSWGNGKRLYKVDHRFRGLNMKLLTRNNCMVISAEADEMVFAGAIYCNAPNDTTQIKSLINKQAKA